MELFKQGLSIEKIAEERGFATSTIQGHLAECISDGTLDISEVLPKEKLDKGLKIIKESTFEGLSELKLITGDEFSYGEFRTDIVSSVTSSEFRVSEKFVSRCFYRKPQGF